MKTVTREEILDRIVAQFVRDRGVNPGVACWEYSPERDEFREWEEIRDEEDYDERIPDEIDVMTVSDWDYWHMYCRPEDFR